jgi:plasmid replication initiation protein
VRPGDLAPRDAQDLMAYPFFSPAKSKRVVPIDFRAGKISIRVEAVVEHGMATIWDADVLIWAASQIVEARDSGLETSRLMAATPYEILTFVGRGTSARDYARLKAALDRLQSTSILTSIRQPTERRSHRFSWINEWKETADPQGRPLRLELILPDWFYTGVLNRSLVLTIDRAYFKLTGGLERWLYRLVRKHGGHQRGGWSLTSNTFTPSPAASHR